MAAVTVSSAPIMDVQGSMRTFIYVNQAGTAGTVSGASGTTLTVPLAVIYKVTFSVGTAVTSFTVSGSVITLNTAGGAMTNEWIQVIGKP